MSHRVPFRPDLRNCVLEDRVVPAGPPNLATFILTTTGYVFMIPFPGANTSGGGTLGSSGPSGGSSSSVSGANVPSGVYISGNAGITNMRPGNITGVPSLAGGATATGGVSVTIQVGSGSDTSGGGGMGTGGTASALVGLATVADPTQRPLSTTIGTTSGSSSAVLPPGQSYQDNAPVPPPASTSVLSQSTSTTTTSNMNTQNSNPFAPGAQSGPTMGPFRGNQLVTSPVTTPMLPAGPASGPGNN
jgi:mucin-19